MNDSFGSNLSALRKRAGSSQEALADQLGVSRQAVSNWERDLSEPDIGTIMKIAESLHVSVSDLMGHPTSNGSSDVPRIEPLLTVISIALAAVHFVLGICGLVNIFAAISLPVMCAFIQSIIYITFTMMNKSDHYEMLAGFDAKKDSIHATRLQMYWTALLSGLTSILFELIFVLIYFVPAGQQMDGAVIMIFSYYAVEAICFMTIRLKIRSRK